MANLDSFNHAPRSIFVFVQPPPHVSVEVPSITGLILSSGEAITGESNKAAKRDVLSKRYEFFIG